MPKPWRPSRASTSWWSTAGVHRAPTIKVAEAAKVIENTQRDLNIALMNELAIIFGTLGHRHPRRAGSRRHQVELPQLHPGLVGGHCIGVDPYYLTHKAEAVGYHPQVILAGRRINDGMGKYVAENTVKELIRAGKAVKGARVLVLGLTFKENVPDIRNSKVVDVVRELEDYGIEVLVHDPLADPEETRHEYGLELTALEAVGTRRRRHPRRRPRPVQSPRRRPARQFCSNGSGCGVVVDVKGMLERERSRKGRAALLDAVARK